MVIGQQLSSILRGTRLQWTASLGRMHYRNNMVALGDRLIVSTSGSEWNKPDDRDGVACLDVTTGSEIWHFKSLGDCNSVAVIDPYVICGTDKGQIFALDASTGNLVAEYIADSPHYGKPILVNHLGEPTAFLISYEGEIVSFNTVTKTFKVLGSAEGRFRASLSTSKQLADEGVFLAGSEDGSIFRISVAAPSLTVEKLYALEARRSSIGPFFIGIRGVGSIVVDGTVAIISYLRETSDREPPLAAIDVSTAALLWYGRRVKTVSKNVDDYGNARVVPVVQDGLIYSTFAYNDSLHAFSRDTGKGEWMVRLDEGFFQNWASPVLIDNDHLAVPRVNGVIHTVNIKSRKVVASTSVEIGRYQNDDESTSNRGRPISNDLGGKVYPQSLLVEGLAATPQIYRGLLLAGGVSGKLRAFVL